MKNIKHFILFVIVIFSANVMFAQSPGYMGKRFVAGYGFHFSPGYIGSKGLTPLNMLHEGYLEFAASKRFMIGFSARFYNSVYKNGRSVEFNTYNVSNSYVNQNYGVPIGSYDIKARNYMLYGKIFHKNYVAPWGRYFMFGVTLNTYDATYDPSVMNILVTDNYYDNYTNNYVHNNLYYTDFGPKTQSYKKIDVMLGFGRSRIIANRVVIDYGYNINVLAMALTVFDAPDDNVLEGTTLTSDYYIEKTSAARVRGVNRFNLFLKVGVLLF
jgi:hypothetical protein